MEHPRAVAAAASSHAIGGKPLVRGDAQGPLLCADVGLSFWGGVDPLTGTVIDHHHPLRGRNLAGQILAIPQGRGSCSGSGVLLELIANGHAPAAILVREPEEILTLGALVGQLVFGRTVPVVQVERDDFGLLARYPHVRLRGGRVELGRNTTPPGRSDGTDAGWHDAPGRVRLQPIDIELLSGRHGRAAQAAMRLLVGMAAVQGAEELVDITRVHIDGCIYTGPASLAFADMLLGLGAEVRVPTTLNAISVDRRRWRDHGVDPKLGEPASALADAYVAMGARPTFTCAPYLLEETPAFGEQIGWAESNAVVYANSVLGARTLKVPDFLDVCMALTGRAPLAGCCRDSGRIATLALDAAVPDAADDAFWPLLGYCCGTACGAEIPLVRGLERSGAGPDALKAFGAAFATTASAPMFHIAGITPEAEGQVPGRAQRIGIADLRAAWEALNGAERPEVGLVSLGNPHFSLSECARLAALVRGRVRFPEVEVIVTCGRHVHESASHAGYVAAAEAFGVRFVTDTCWCMLGEPVVPRHVRTLMTNSGKYAHYAPGLTGRAVRFGSLRDCVEAACSGRAPATAPAWLCSGSRAKS